MPLKELGSGPGDGRAEVQAVLESPPRDRIGPVPDREPIIGGVESHAYVVMQVTGLVASRGIRMDVDVE